MELDHPQFSEFADLMELDGLLTNEVGIGFLPHHWRVSTPHLTIEALPNLDERKACLEGCLISEGGIQYFHPLVTSWKSRLGQPYEEVEGSTRSANLYFPPVSHILALDDPCLDIRGQEVQFIIHFIGYLAGTRLQFHDWRLDTRVVAAPRARSFFVQDVDVNNLAISAYQKFASLRTENKISMVNCLYLVTRSPHLFWEWERFMYDFMVVDAIREIYRSEQNRSDKPRLEELCEAFYIPFESAIDPRLRAIRRLRNDLFHQGLWAGNTPGSGSPSSAWKAHLELRSLLDRLIAGILNIGSSFRRTSWWSRSPSFLGND